MPDTINPVDVHGKTEPFTAAPRISVAADNEVDGKSNTVLEESNTRALREMRKKIFNGKDQYVQASPGKDNFRQGNVNGNLGLVKMPSKPSQFEKTKISLENTLGDILAKTVDGFSTANAAHMNSLDGSLNLFIEYFRHQGIELKEDSQTKAALKLLISKQLNGVEVILGGRTESGRLTVGLGSEYRDYVATLINQIEARVVSYGISDPNRCVLYLQNAKAFELIYSPDLNLEDLSVKKLESQLVALKSFLEKGISHPQVQRDLEDQIRNHNIERDMKLVAVEQEEGVRQKQIALREKERQIDLQKLRIEVEAKALDFVEAVAHSQIITEQLAQDLENFYQWGERIRKMGLEDLHWDEIQEFFDLQTRLTKESRSWSINSADAFKERDQKIRHYVERQISPEKNPSICKTDLDIRWVNYAAGVEDLRSSVLTSSSQTRSSPKVEIVKDNTPVAVADLDSANYLFKNNRWTLADGIHGVAALMVGLGVLASYGEFRSSMERVEKKRATRLEAIFSGLALEASLGVASSVSYQLLLNKLPVRKSEYLAGIISEDLSKKIGFRAGLAWASFDFLRNRARLRSTPEYGYKKERSITNFITASGDVMAGFPHASAMIAGIAISIMGRTARGKLEAKGAASYLAEAIISGDQKELLNRFSNVQLDQVDPVDTAVKLTNALRDLGYFRKVSNPSPEVLSVLKYYRNILLEKTTAWYRSGYGANPSGIDDSEALALLVLGILSDNKEEQMYLKASYQAALRQMHSEENIKRAFNYFTRQGFAGPLWSERLLTSSQVALKQAQEALERISQEYHSEAALRKKRSEENTKLAINDFAKNIIGPILGEKALSSVQAALIEYHSADHPIENNEAQVSWREKELPFPTSISSFRYEGL